MMRILSFFALTAALVTGVPGCSDDSEKTSRTIPYEPTPQMLADGPEPGKQFLQWNALGRQIGASASYEVTGTCYLGQATDIYFPGMLGLSVQASSLADDSLQCTVQIRDSTYTQTEYLPGGYTWADSVTYWVDSSVVFLPGSVTPQDVAFYWYNRGDGTFFQIPTTYFNSQWFARTVHFSRYILGQKRS